MTKPYGARHRNLPNLPERNPTPEKYPHALCWNRLIMQRKKLHLLAFGDEISFKYGKSFTRLVSNIYSRVSRLKRYNFDRYIGAYFLRKSSMYYVSIGTHCKSVVVFSCTLQDTSLSKM